MTEPNVKFPAIKLQWFIAVFLGGVVGLMVCIIAGSSIKWIAVFTAMLLLTLITMLCGDKQKFAFGFFLFVLPFFVAKSIFNSHYTMITSGPGALGIFLYDIPLFFLVLFLAKERLFCNRTSIAYPEILPLYLLFVLWSFLSIFNAKVPILTFIELAWLLKMALVMTVIYNLIQTRKNLIFVLKVLIVGLLAQEIITLSQAYFKVWFTVTGDTEMTFLQSAGQQVFRAGGAMGPHNVQSAYYVLLLAISAALALVVRQRRHMLALISIVFIGVYCQLLTYSRNGYLSLSIALLILLLLAVIHGKITHKKLFLTGSLALAFMIMLTPSLRKNIASRILSNAAFQPRIESMKVAGNMIRHHPFLGVGLNNFAVSMGDPEYSPTGLSSLQQTYFQGEFYNTVVHNKFLLIAAQTGLIGLLFFCLLLKKLFSIALGLLKSPDLFYWGLGAGTLAAFSGATVQMMFDIYNSDLLISVFWTLAAITLAAHKISHD